MTARQWQKLDDKQRRDAYLQVLQRADRAEATASQLRAAIRQLEARLHHTYPDKIGGPGLEG